MTDLGRRLHDAGAALLSLRGELVAGEPWPLSAAWGTEPEADWGPREVLAHVNEMLPYWSEQLRVVVAGDPSAPVPFGRVATDSGRLDRIERDRQLPVAEQLDAIGAGLAQAGSFIDGLSEADLERVGVHPSRGELTVRDSLERFLVAHLEDHVAQLRTILGRNRPT